eukprot:5658118-Pleurochrysis_carterae.AAC.4
MAWPARRLAFAEPQAARASRKYLSVERHQLVRLYLYYPTLLAAISNGHLSRRGLCWTLQRLLFQPSTLSGHLCATLALQRPTLSAGASRGALLES